MIKSHSKERCNARIRPGSFPCYSCQQIVYHFTCDCESSFLVEERRPPWTKHICDEYANRDRSLIYVNGSPRLWLHWDIEPHELNRLSKRVMRNLRCDGVYIIWYFDKSNFPRIRPKIVKIGKGPIREGIESDRRNQKVQRYTEHTLLIQWASVPSKHMDGVAAYLSQGLQPLVGSRYSADTVIRVELPLRLERFYEYR